MRSIFRRSTSLRRLTRRCGNHGGQQRTARQVAVRDFKTNSVHRQYSRHEHAFQNNGRGWQSPARNGADDGRERGRPHRAPQLVIPTDRRSARPNRHHHCGRYIDLTITRATLNGRFRRVAHRHIASRRGGQRRRQHYLRRDGQCRHLVGDLNGRLDPGQRLLYGDGTRDRGQCGQLHQLAGHRRLADQQRQQCRQGRRDLDRPPPSQRAARPGAEQNGGPDDLHVRGRGDCLHLCRAEHRHRDAHGPVHSDR